MAVMSRRSWRTRAFATPISRAVSALVRSRPGIVGLVDDENGLRLVPIFGAGALVTLRFAAHSSTTSQVLASDGDGHESRADWWFRRRGAALA